MIKYSFQAQKPNGEPVEGVVEAETEALALELLQDEGLVPIGIEPLQTSLLDMNLDFLQRVKAKDLVIFSRQLSVMVDANLPLVDSLKLLVKQTSNPKLKKILSAVAEEVEGGVKLSMALGEYPKIFDEFYLSIVRSGETSGQLSEVLGYLADQLEKDYDLKSKIKGAMVYPAFILSGLVVVGTLMMIFVVPKMTEILQESGAQLPLSTRILIFVSNLMVNYWYIGLILAIALIVGFRMSLNYPKPRYYFDWLKLHAPIFGSLFQRIYVVRMTQTLSTLSSGKVPVVDALEVVKGVVGNDVYKELINRTIAKVKDGNTLSSVFSQSNDVPTMVSQMISVGEETGRMDDILKRLTSFYTREIDALVASLITLIEPLVMILMGVAVGVMVAAIILPIYTLSTSV